MKNIFNKLLIPVKIKKELTGYWKNEKKILKLLEGYWNNWKLNAHNYNHHHLKEFSNVLFVDIYLEHNLKDL